MEIENKNKNNRSEGQNPKVDPIRTLESDIAKEAAAKKSGLPELPPFLTKKNPPPPPKKIIQEKIVIRENPFTRSVKPEIKKEIPPVPKKMSLEEKFAVSPIRTYTGDVAQAVKAGNTSVIQIAVAEEKSREEDKQVEETENSQARKNILMILGSIVFIAGGLGIFYYFTFVSKPETKVVIPKKTELVTSQSQKEIIFTGNKETLMQDLKAAVAEEIPDSTVENISVKNQTTMEAVPAPDFLSLITATAPPPIFLRALNREFIFGIHSTTKLNPFLLLKIDSYENAFAGMLTWESTMRKDLGPLFLSPLDQEKSYAEGTTTLPYERKFEDSIIKNIDVRQLRNKDGNIILLYAFINKDLLIITTQPATFLEILAKLQSVQNVR